MKTPERPRSQPADGIRERGPFAEKTAGAHPGGALASLRRGHARPAQVLTLQRAVGNRATRALIDAAPARRPNYTGLPDRLKAGVESLSGLSLDDVRVHYNSTKPAGVHALAYTRGSEIHVGPGQEPHLPHEAWHVVQQKQGRVRATAQLRGETAVNDDAGLEREADVMGARALEAAPREGGLVQAAPGAAVIQCVRGGLEFTENQNPGLESFTVPPAPGGAIAQTSLLNIQGAQISTFVVPPGLLPPLARFTDHTLAVSGQVSLTNDVTSAEWVIARHGADRSPATMRTLMTNDVALLFQMRRDLSDAVTTLQAANVGSAIALVPGNVATLNLAPALQGVFIYTPGTSQGTAQITAQYTNAETIRRINLLNASKYMQGTKVDTGEDVTRVIGAEGWGLSIADGLRTTSFSQARALLTALEATSNPVLDAALPAPPHPAEIFSAAQVALVKLMVLNDAAAATMTRYSARLGQSEQKNIQRFFPKSRRDEYTKAVARMHVDPLTMAALHAEITRTAAADAQLYFDMADPAALRTNETTTALGAGPDTLRIIATGGMLRNGTASAADITHLKTHVLGANGALLATWIGRAAQAYTDTSVAGTGQYNPAGTVGNVIRSTQGFTPVAGANPGAIYEFREREIAADDSTWAGTVVGEQPLLAAVNRLFTASV